MAYAILRALFVEPLFDELATLYWYIQTGYLPGRGATMDANNHILNSLVSNQFFLLFGDHFFVYRLFALCTFPIYFFASRKFLLLSASNPFSFLIFLALISVHWIFDYFSFSRGYGPSLAFLVLAFCFIRNWLDQRKTSSFIGIVLSFIIALLCNLSLFIPLIILLFYLIIISIIQIRQFSRKQLAGIWITTLCFLSFLIPVYIYILKLKKAGALWWGSSDGLWEVTGKSISKNVLFTDNHSLKFISLFLLFILFFIFMYTWRKTGFVFFLQKTEFWIPALFGSTLVSFILLAQFMDLNYPMDRVGMYLVVLFILTFGLLTEKYPFTKWSLLLLLWFPLSFVFKMNLNTSVFSPEDRIHKTFYQKIILEVPDSTSISADYVSQASYAYLTRKEKIPHIAVDYLPEDTLSKGDYHISWIEKLEWPGYSCLLYDPVSGTRLYKRTIPFKTHVILDTLIYPKKSKESVIPLVDFDLRRFTNQLIQTSVEGNVQLDKYCLDLNLRHEIQSRKEQIRRTDNTRFNWYFGRKTAYRFRYPNHRILVLPEDRFLHIRFYNDDLNKVNLEAIRVKIVVVTEKFK
ncbi:hypothetical protein [Fluviicola sp.]|jgi:hypothetical protein|uniref:hypothetical protein n=1 Tax=Fluviicola sp. TaxID=1917219 RepID=UPI00261E61DB|nr:hypothetical protein [Fluviicola sp.]